ncbi:unnamed protein product [Rotaria magnacalcarata]|uniref:Uncharacterized protein n=1 Tax=Rotaria magnacalcarata TaxID=392030 RepID=A0A816BEZ5_9BILA|nr:unnamed protein product [Rotaria magnacalcarata]CAF1609565.1 unnamed protein product [Rotaria magnacalcarata]
MLAQLRHVVNDVTICTEPIQCKQYLDGVKDTKAFIIISGSLGQQLVPDIHSMIQLDAIYIFCSNKERHKQWAAKCKYAENFNVYRGQGFGKTEFRHLLDAEGGLLAFNNFLSTSKEKYVATDFVDGKMAKNPDTVGVIFIMTINPTQSSTSTTPFVMVDEHSDFSSEHEILFAMHTIFRVGEIKQTANNSRLWEVQLTITDDSDPQLAALTDCFKEEIGGEG